MSEQPQEPTSAPTEPTQPVPASPTPAQVHPSQTNGLAVASLVTGIIALVTGWVFIGIVIGIAAIVLGAIALKKPHGKGMSIAGIITGAVGALAGLAFAAFWIIALFAAGSIANSGIKSAEFYAQELKSSQAAEQSLIESDKDFDKGETARFGLFDVKVNSVELNYQPTEDYYTPGDGNQFVLVNMSVTNKDDSPNYITSYDFKLNADGVADSSYFLDVAPAFNGGQVSSNATTTGNIVFKAPIGAKQLKLQYETTANNSKDYTTVDLVYTLGL
jgi:Domain of unknown function (DUF4352)